MCLRKMLKMLSILDLCTSTSGDNDQINSTNLKYNIKTYESQLQRYVRERGFGSQERQEVHILRSGAYDFSIHTLQPYK